MTDEVPDSARVSKDVAGKSPRRDSLRTPACEKPNARAEKCVSDGICRDCASLQDCGCRRRFQSRRSKVKGWKVECRESRLSRREVLKNGSGMSVLSASAAVGLLAGHEERTVWQIRPDKCVNCDKCASE